MRQEYKQRSARKGRAADAEIELPTEAASGTTDAQDLIDEIDKLLMEG